MIYIVNGSTKPDYNIALEEYCFRNLRHHGKIFILWINEPAIIVGKNQNTIEEVNTEYLKDNNIQVVRRISGGGAVYHDHNNLNYTIISNEEKGAEFDFKTFSQPVIDTLADLGVRAEFTGRNDIVINGMKICGNAQAYLKGRVMHHGCLLFDTDLSVLSKALEQPKDIIKSRGVKSIRSAVSNILPHLPTKITVQQFSDRLLEKMKEEFSEMVEYKFTDEELDDIEKIRATKFGTWDWNYGNSPKFGIERHSRFNAGKIDVHIDVKNSIINQIRFFGTFFGNNVNLDEIEKQLVGVRYSADDIKQTLSQLDFNNYFAGFSLDEMVEAIVD